VNLLFCQCHAIRFDPTLFQYLIDDVRSRFAEESIDPFVGDMQAEPFKYHLKGLAVVFVVIEQSAVQIEENALDHDLTFPIVNYPHHDPLPQEGVEE